MDFAAAIAVLIAISLAGERIVVIVKTIAPGLFKEPPVEPGTDKPSDTADRSRRLRVQAVAFVACTVAAATLAEPRYSITGEVDLGGALIPVLVVGLLTMGGSAFWSQILGITSTLKDLKSGQLAALRAERPAAQPVGPQADQVDIAGKMFDARAKQPS